MRAVIIALLVLASGVARADTKYQLTVWNTTIEVAGSARKLVVFGDNPTTMLPRCRCVAGMWKVAKGGETATHFKGTLDALSFNHARGAKTKSLTIKIRKTRHLMGAAKDHRAALHAIMRGAGQLMLREVKGGEWEVVGYSTTKLGDVFDTYPRWRADPKRPPKPAPATPVIDTGADAVALVKLINDYRKSIGLPRIAVSKALTKVARAHVRDLNDNKPTSGRCNMHSWSSKGDWTACCYDKSKQAAKCMWVKPKEIAGYAGHGYEIAASASGIAPAQALQQWQGSPAHHEVMINKGIWTKPWKAFGVAIEGDYAVAWFGERADKN